MSSVFTLITREDGNFVQGFRSAHQNIELFIYIPEFKLAVSQFNGKSSNQSNSYRYLEGENDIAAHTTVQQREIV